MQQHPPTQPHAGDVHRALLPALKVPRFAWTVLLDRSKAYTEKCSAACALQAPTLQRLEQPAAATAYCVRQELMRLL